MNWNDNSVANFETISYLDPEPAIEHQCQSISVVFVFTADDRADKNNRDWHRYPIGLKNGSKVAVTEL